MDISSTGHIPPGFLRHAQNVTPTTGTGNGQGEGQTPAVEAVVARGQTRTYAATDGGVSYTREKTLPDGRVLSKTTTIQTTEDGVERSHTITNPNGKIIGATAELLDGATLGELVDLEAQEGVAPDAPARDDADLVVTDDVAPVVDLVEEVVAEGGGSLAPVVDASEALIGELLEEVLSEDEERDAAATA